MVGSARRWSFYAGQLLLVVEASAGGEACVAHAGGGGGGAAKRGQCSGAFWYQPRQSLVHPDKQVDGGGVQDTLKYVVSPLGLEPPVVPCRPVQPGVVAVASYVMALQSEEA